ncbi:GTP 3',8-cyclase MoaA [Nitriliruptoria bacterium AS10]|nr:GTP 3',8-cyclase MoaA [Salsipaludibacter albus]
MPGPTDAFARPLTDLRVSVTDRCNFRCRYCMPREIFGPDHAFLERDELLSFEEITRLVGLFTTLGVHKVRLTGGEPLLRSDLPTLIAGIAGLDRITDLALTTNGTLLPRHAADLAAAGLDRVTVSLDALDDEIHRAISDTRVPVTAVLAGIEAARAAGLPVKVNTVVKRGVNDDEITAMAAWGRREGITVRFIEYMDVGATNGWRLDDVVPAAEVVERLSTLGPLEPIGDGTPGGDVGDVQTGPGQVAERLRWSDGAGEVGVIASVTRPFCRTCSRARLSSVGELFTCLFATSGTDLRGPLRDGATDDEVVTIARDTWTHRTDRYSEERTAETARDDRVEMSYIGG